MHQERIKVLRAQAESLLQDIKNETELGQLEVRFLGRKSELNEILKSLKDLSPEERQTVGPAANAAKQFLTQSFAEARSRIKQASIDWEAERIDVTLPAAVALKNTQDVADFSVGHLHILTQVQREIEDIFLSMGFEVADGPEVETEYYNFDVLNMGPDHPAREMQDTYWLRQQFPISNFQFPNKNQDKDLKIRNPQSARLAARQATRNQGKLLPRTHTSAVQVRYMETHTPPFRIIIPGRIFRNEATDTYHEHTFYQFESLMVGDDTTVAYFKYVAEEFFRTFFDRATTIRLRPSFFPYTEPSFEFDIQCVMCGGSGCSACKHTGWVEIGGAGMVHQNVFVAGGYKRNRYQGFAWGFGINRLAMMKYGIPDVRLFQSSDLRFLQQF